MGRDTLAFYNGHGVAILGGSTLPKKAFVTGLDAFPEGLR